MFKCSRDETVTNGAMSLLASNPSLLTNLVGLLDAGHLTQAEFDAEKSKLLGPAALPAESASPASSSSVIQELAHVLRAALSTGVPVSACSTPSGSPAIPAAGSAQKRKQSHVVITPAAKRPKHQPSMFSYVSSITKRADGTTRRRHLLRVTELWQSGITPRLV